MAAIASLLQEYLDYLEIEKNRSRRTRENYERYLKAFFSVANIRAERDITLERVTMFRKHLARLKTVRGEEYKKNTQSYYLIALRNFLKFLAKRDHPSLAPEKVELPHMSMREITVLEYRDLERLLAAPKGGDTRSLRDKAVLETLFSTGLRISELCALNRSIDIDRGELSVRGKGGKVRVVFLSSRAKHALKNYLAARTDVEEALFVSFAKAKQPKVIGRIIPRAVQRLIEYYSRKAGIMERVTPHQLRHLFATDLLMGGADLRSVQALLGHANISTTQIYTHITNKELREIHQAFHGRRRSGRE